MFFATLMTLTEASYSGKGLVAVPPDIPRNTSILDLSYNSIIITNTSFAQFDGLEKLVLSYNNLKDFPNVTSSGDTLLRLYLDHNLISFIPQDLLEGLNVIIELNLNHNSFYVFPDLSPIGGTLTNLYTMYLLFDSIPPQHLDSLSNLIRIDFVSNELTVVPMLGGMCAKAESLYFIYNKIATVHPEVFLKCSSVSKLDLTSNRLAVFPDISYLNSSLEILVLVSNQLTSLDTQMLSSFSTLSTINVAHNLLETFPKFTGHSVNLTTLTFTNNRINTIGSSNLSKLQKLRYLRLDGNKLSTLTYINTPIDTLQYLYLGGNSLENFPDMAKLSKNLIVLSLYGNRNITSITKDGLKPLQHLEVLKLQGTGLTDLPNFNHLNSSKVKTLIISTKALPTPIKIAYGPHMNILGRFPKVYMQSTNLKTLPYTCPFSKEFEMHLDGSPLDLCTCEMAWIKAAVMEGFGLHVTDTWCPEASSMWSSLSVQDILATCNSTMRPGCLKSKYCASGTAIKVSYRPIMQNVN